MTDMCLFVMCGGAAPQSGPLQISMAHRFAHEVGSTFGDVMWLYLARSLLSWLVPISLLGCKLRVVERAVLR